MKETDIITRVERQIGGKIPEQFSPVGQLRTLDTYDPFDNLKIIVGGTSEPNPDDYYEDVQCVMQGHNKGKYSKHDIAFRGMLTCAHDECTVTGEVKKQKYVYYRCSGYRGKCDLPRFREEEIAVRLGAILKDIYIPDEVVRAIENSLQRTQQEQQRESANARSRVERELEAVRRRLDQAYVDKLDGKISEEFWQPKVQIGGLRNCASRVK